MIQRKKGHDKVLSLSKLKTLEYRIFRKLREKLRNFWSSRANIQSWTAKLQQEYDICYNKFYEECRELVGKTTLPQPFDYYINFADTAFNAVKESESLYDMLCNYYVDFLTSIVQTFKKDTSIFTSQVFAKSSEPRYIKLDKNNPKVDDKSWYDRKANTPYFTPEKTEKKAKRETRSRSKAHTKAEEAQPKSRNKSRVEVKRSEIPTKQHDEDEMTTEEIRKQIDALKPQYTEQ